MQRRGLIEMNRSKKECLKDKERKLMMRNGFTLVELSLSLVFIERLLFISFFFRKDIFGVFGLEIFKK